MNHRRTFLQSSLGLGLAALAAPSLANTLAQPAGTPKPAPAAGKPPLFKISLAEWSLNRAIFGGKMTNLDFPRVAKEEYGIDAIEYVNQFFKDKAKDNTYLTDLKKRCDDLGVRSILIMCDGEGALGDPDSAGRTKAVENHYKWADAAKFLGCHSIRVNAESKGAADEQKKLAADGLRRLTEYCAKLDLNCIVENHGGLSSHGDWLAGVMKLVDNPRVGTLPDFGNFYEYDRYQGVTDLMPFAKAVSAKTHDFAENGDEAQKDYRRLMKIVLDAGYRSWVGIEYEGSKLPEREGIAKTKALLEKVRAEMTK